MCCRKRSGAADSTPTQGPVSASADKRFAAPEWPVSTGVVIWPVYPPVMYTPAPAAAPAAAPRVKRATAPKAPVCPPGTVSMPAEATKGALAKAPEKQTAENVCMPEPAKVTTVAAPEAKPAPATGGSGD